MDMDIDKYIYSLKAQNEILTAVNTMLGESILKMESMKYDDVLKKEEE